MIIRYSSFLLFAVLLVIVELPCVSARQSEYPMMEKMAQKVIEKYKTSSGEELKAQKEKPASPDQEQ